MTHDEEKFVVVVDGKRVPGLHESRQKAEEAATRKKLSESANRQEPPKVEVKQNLYG